MLTKEEREEIAERLCECDNAFISRIYECLYGRTVPKDTSLREDDKAIVDRLVDLCDTSNMIELPVDKDGEVIRIGDTVYDSDGDEYKVTGYKTLFEDTNIFLSNGSEPVYATVLAHYVTHKQLVTIGALVERIKNVMNDDSTTVWAYDELDDIATKLEHLGDNDE